MEVNRDRNQEDLLLITKCRRDDDEYSVTEASGQLHP